MLLISKYWRVQIEFALVGSSSCLFLFFLQSLSSIKYLPYSYLNRRLKPFHFHLNCFFFCFWYLHLEMSNNQKKQILVNSRVPDKCYPRMDKEIPGPLRYKQEWERWVGLIKPSAFHFHDDINIMLCLEQLALNLLGLKCLTNDFKKVMQ